MIILANKALLNTEKIEEAKPLLAEKRVSERLGSLRMKTDSKIDKPHFITFVL